MNADPEVMRYFARPLTHDETYAMVGRIEVRFDARGYGLWAVERKADAAFLGFIGLSWQTFEAPFTPCTEVGWRLARSAWGQGYATEGAREALRFGFEEMSLEEIFSFTAATNGASRHVMEKVGLHRDAADDFEYPNLPPGHPLRPHVLYRLRREEYVR